jgi:hypothetical protein
MEQNPNANAADMFPTEARANPTIFRQNRSLQDVFSIMKGKIEKNRPKAQSLGAQAIPKISPNVENSIPENNSTKVIPRPIAQPSPAPSMQVAMAGGSDQKQSAVNCTIDGSVRAACS